MTNKKIIKVGLIGNPNTGKTSLLNSLTNLNLHVGNWPGKTIEKKECTIHFQNTCINIVDLPGTYSIAPYSEEEKISRHFIINEKPDVIIQTIDVNSLKRHLLMTMELLALNKNLVLAFNFNNEAKKRNIKINIKKITKQLQIPIVQIEANTGKNKEKLLEQVLLSSQHKPKTPAYLKKLLISKKEINHYKAINFIKEKISPFYKDQEQNGLTKKIDALILNKYTAFPIFLLVIFLIFKTTFSLSQPLIAVIDNLFEKLSTTITNLGLPQIITSFLTEGLIGGIGTILSFTPLIFILFFFIALLEDSGYLSRTVVLVDRLFNKFGISGRVFIPMILGFGCNVPAILATRTIRNKKDRLIAIFINSFSSCGARLPIYMLFTDIFFPHHAGLIIIILYVFGIITAFSLSLMLSKLIKSNEPSRLIIELPPYRLPTFRNVHKRAWFQTSLFIKKAGTIILMAVIIVWFLASFPLGVEYGSSLSILGKIGKFISPVFKPLGFGHWTFSIALLSGLIAKETVVSTLGTLYGIGQTGLMSVMPHYISPAGALAFLFFSLLYIPCLTTISVIKKETESWKLACLQILTTIMIAWFVAFGIYSLVLFFI